MFKHTTIGGVSGNLASSVIFREIAGMDTTSSTESPIVREVTIGPCRLIQGDCESVMAVLPRVDSVLTDPPYGISITKSHRLATSRGMGGGDWDENPISVECLNRVLAAGEDCIIWGGNYYELPPARCILVWDKQNDGRDFADLEMAWTSLDAVARVFRMRPMNMDGGKVHPTQKPVDLMKWCIKQFGDSVQTILDPFMGSGTTGVACIRTERQFIGIEREPKYFDIAVKRITEAWRLKQSELPFEPPKKFRQGQLICE